jgi:sn-glycerol 3-phosphate transport system permease protein
MTRVAPWIPFAYLLPALTLIVLFCHGPMLLTAVDSLYPTRNPAKLGASAVNYQTLWRDGQFWLVLGNNLAYAAVTVPLSMALALVMAALVDARLPGRGWVRAAFFCPTILPMIAVANIWLFFYTPEAGLFDRVLSYFGVGPTNWLGQPETALRSVMAVTVWKESGLFMIFYLAAFQNVPPELHEAAQLEGAGRLARFWRITLPLVGPTTLFVFVIAVINAFRVVDHVLILTHGGPNNASSLLLYYLYEVGFVFWDTALAAAITVVLMTVLLLVAIVQLRVLEPRTHYR